MRVLKNTLFFPTCVLLHVAKVEKEMCNVCCMTSFSSRVRPSLEREKVEQEECFFVSLRTINCSEFTRKFCKDLHSDSERKTDVLAGIRDGFSLLRERALNYASEFYEDIVGKNIRYSFFRQQTVPALQHLPRPKIHDRSRAVGSIDRRGSEKRNRI